MSRKDRHAQRDWSWLPEQHGKWSQNLDIELLCLESVKGHVKRHEGIGETLHTKANRAMAEVRTTCFRNWIVADVNDAVQIVSDNLGDIV